MLFWIQIMENCEDKCFLSLFLKAFSIKKKFKFYDSEKKLAKSGKENVSECSCSDISNYINSGCHSPNAGMEKIKLYERFLTEEGSMRNFILKSAFGFIGGILLTYIFFIFLVFSLNFTLKKATYICMGLGVILSLGLAFSVRIRCTVFLCIPQLFSKRGRQALLAYAFILALSGPAKNTLHNVEVMSESLACRQEQLRQVENELLKCVQKPNSAAKKTIEKLLEKINSAVKDFKNFILQLYRTCYDILQTVLQGQKWLYSITTLCQKKTGRPSRRCLYFLQEASENCQDISPESDWKKECQIPESSQAIICSTYGTKFCSRRDVPQHLPVARLQKHLSNFKHRAMNIFYVRVEGHQTYSQSNRSNFRYEEVQGVATEIRQKTDQFLQYFDFMSLIFGIFILVLFMKVIIYRYKFLTDDKYDNRYITHDFVDIDRTRAEFKMETILPLEPREKTKYIKVTSIRLVPCEKVRLMSSFVFLLFASFKIIVHMLTDSSLNWILSNIRREEKLLYMSSLREEEPSITVHVEGEGLIAAFVQNVTKAVKRQSVSGRLDPTPCLPDPIPPDWNRYYQILALVVICWLLALCEPYGLRLRHTVMVTYHPDRARERAIWLYNRIISDRSHFVKFARRDIRRKYKDVSEEGTLGFRFRFSLKQTTLKCLLCKVTLSDDNNRMKCPTYNCPGLFCVRCYESLKICSICSDPAEYGDMSDISEEKDSSEEENWCKCSLNSSDKSVEKTKKSKEKLYLNLKKPKFSLDPKSSKEQSEKIFSRINISESVSSHTISSDFEREKRLAESNYRDWITPPYSERFRISIKSSVYSKEYDEQRRESIKDEPENCNEKTSLYRKVSEYLHDQDNFFTTSDENIGSIKESEILLNKPSKGLVRGPQIKEKRSILKTSHSFEEVKKKSSDKMLHWAEKELVKAKSEKPEKAEKAVKAEKPTKSTKPIKSIMSTKSIKSTDSQGKRSHRSDTPEILPSPINVKYYELQETQFPFVDPSNIHEINHKWSHSSQDTQNDCEWFLNSVSLSTESSRVRVRLPEDTDSIQENINLTITEQTTNSSSGYKWQFKGQPSKIKLRKKKSRLKTTSGKLNINVKPQQFSSLYRIEKENSNKKILSMNPTPLKCKKKKKKSTKLQGNSREILKMAVVCPRRTKQKKTSGLTSNLVRFFQKRVADQKVFDDERSSESDGKFMPSLAVFLSDEEFEKMSKNIREKLGLKKQKPRT